MGENAHFLGDSWPALPRPRPPLPLSLPRGVHAFFFGARSPSAFLLFGRLHTDRWRFQQCAQRQRGARKTRCSLSAGFGGGHQNLAHTVSLRGPKNGASKTALFRIAADWQCERVGPLTFLGGSPHIFGWVPSHFWHGPLTFLGGSPHIFGMVPSHFWHGPLTFYEGGVG